jgi:hypothetical protein
MKPGQSGLLCDHKEEAYTLYSGWPTEPSEQFDRLQQSFEAACVHLSAEEYQAHVGGHSVLLRVAGGELAASLRRPLVADDRKLSSSSVLTVNVWDSIAAREVYAPSPSADLNTYGVVSSDSEGRFIVDNRPNGLLILDRVENRIIGHYAGARSLFLDERARPLHRLLSIWLGDRGVQFIHGGMVCPHPDLGVLLAGGGGAGKSTTSLLCLMAGFGFLSDDFVAFSQQPSGPVAHCLFSSAVVQMHHLQRFPGLTAAAQPPNHSHEDKSIVFVEELLPGQVQPSSAITAVLLPKVMNRAQTQIIPASLGEALLALAPSSVMLLPGGGPRALERLASLLRAVPAFRLELGYDFERIPELIAAQVGTTRLHNKGFDAASCGGSAATREQAGG